MKVGLVWAAAWRVFLTNHTNKMSIEKIYHNFWGKPKPQFTELEKAAMEGGHSLEEPAKPQMEFIKSLLVKDSNKD